MLPGRIATWLVTTPASVLRRRTVQASVYVLAQQLLGAAIRLGGSLLLTRMLPPDAFGLMAVVYVIATGLALLSDLGVAQNVLVNKDGEDTRFLQTAWTLQVVRAGLICAASMTSAVTIFVLAENDVFQAGTVYRHDDLPWIICAFSLTVMVSGFESIKLKQAQRRLQFGRLTALEIGSQLIGMVAMIAAAAIYHSVWALVLGAAVSGFAKTVGSHLFFPGVTARFAWYRPAVADLIHFGKWIMVSSALTFFVQSGDRLILGGIIDVTTLGYYSIAVTLIGVVQMLYFGIISGVMLPALSEAAGKSQEHARTVFKQFQFQSDLFLLSAAGCLFMSGPAIIGLLYDARYASAGPVLSLLALGLIGLRFAPVEQYCLMQKAVHNFAIWNGARAFVMCAGLPLGYALAGFKGAMIAIVLTQYAAWPFAIYSKARNGLVDWPREAICVPAFAVGAALGWVGAQGLAVLTHALRP